MKKAQLQSNDGTKTVPLDQAAPKQTVIISEDLTSHDEERLLCCLSKNKDVILGLRKIRALGVTTCIIRTDSKVVAGQVEKDYAAKDPALMQYLAAIRSLERQFKGFTLQHVD
jgi:hypothetical protein